MADEEEPDCCPLCMEELDLTDKTFNACPCGYQVCLWCWHQIKNEYNGLCPACRAPYTELSKHKNPLDREDVLRRTKQRKQKEKHERRTAAQTKLPTVNRKNLTNVRVMQRNLVYVIGLPPRFTDEEVLRSRACFGQYGRIVKAVVNKAHLHADRGGATASAYITFAVKDDALACIMAVDGFILDGAVLRASFGTTKYCNFFLRNLQCNNPECLYLHELGEQEDSFTKEEMQTALHSGKAFREVTGVNYGNEVRAGSSFPPAPNRRHDRYVGADDDEEDEEGATFSSSSSASPPPAAAASSSPSPPPAVGRRRPSGTPTHARPRAARAERSGDSSSSSASPGPRREQPYSKAAARTGSPGPSIARGAGKPSLRVDTSVAREEKQQAVETVVGPLEALKLATGSTAQEPAWAQPFPAATAAHVDDADDAVGAGDGAVFSPFGLGFEGGIRRPSSAAMGGAGAAIGGAEDAWTSAPLEAPAAAAALSSSSFASIDAIFSQRSESSEALAGLLGVELSAAPMAHGTPTNGTSRFAFANTRGESPASHRSPAHHSHSRHSHSDGGLFDGVGLGHRHSFGGYDTAVPASAGDSLGFPSRHDASAFPPLGAAPSSMPPPLPPRSSAFHGGFGASPGLHRTASMPSSALGLGDDGGANGLAFLQQMLPNVNISFGGDFPSSGADEPPQTSGRRLFQRSNSVGPPRSSPPSGLGAWQSHDAFGSPAPAPTFHDPAIVSLSTPSGLSNGFYGEDESERGFHSFGDTFRRSGALLK